MDNLEFFRETEQDISISILIAISEYIYIPTSMYLERERFVIMTWLT